MSKAARGYPHKQEFCVGARPNKTKVNSWWNPRSTTYWAKRAKAKSKTANSPEFYVQPEAVDVLATPVV